MDYQKHVWTIVKNKPLRKTVTAKRKKCTQNYYTRGYAIGERALQNANYVNNSDVPTRLAKQQLQDWGIYT